MYQIGEWIVYGNSGACRIEDIRTNAAKGADAARLHYILRPMSHNCTIITPIDSTKVPMRRIITKDEAKRLIDTIPSYHVVAYQNQDWRQLTEHYKSLVKSCDCSQLLELTMSIYEKKVQKCKIGSTDEKYLRLGEELLLGELSAALGIPIQEVPAYIKTRVQELSEADSN